MPADERLDAAAKAVAELIPPDEHGHLCPYWRRRRDGPSVDVCDCWIRRRARNYAAAALKTAPVSAESGPELLASWPQWWCQTCGNRYAAGLEEHAQGCSCGTEMVPITLQIVTRPTTEDPHG